MNELQYRDAYAALTINNQQIGDRLHCILILHPTTKKILLDRELKFDPVPNGGIAEIRFYDSKERGTCFLEWTHAVLHSGDTLTMLN